MWPNLHFLVSFTEEILDEKLNFLSSDSNKKELQTQKITIYSYQFFKKTEWNLINVIKIELSKFQQSMC